MDTKVMLNEVHIKGQSMDSDEEGNIEHLSPQTFLETQGEGEVQYSLRSPEGSCRPMHFHLKLIVVVFL